MRTITVSSLVFLLWIAGTAFAAGPAISVCVSDATGKVAFRGMIPMNAPFATGNLAAGNYVVQFNSNSAALQDHQYLVIVSAGQKKVMADSVPGETFNGGGVAMRVKVSAGSKMTGQIARLSASVANANGMVRVIEDEKMRKFQDRSGEGSLRNHYAGRQSLMTGQTGRGF